ncbi:mechanosensitive ion channel family protein [Halomicrobium urmianum]|uniref:mechanosensitive ion channel family protein n=1 Tax=Halomicrobium urmianum TaxID=1586233 RepID=UPI001CDA25EE|nr:mechanosensitive ion channel family protein [Halomicrobium urmianum]
MTEVPLLQAQPGAIARALADAGVPYADAIGSALSFVVVFAVVYLAGKIAILPAIDRVLRSRSLDAHARRPLRRVASIVVLFAAAGIAFRFAGYGDILTALATVGAAATLAIGFAMQDVLKNFVAGIFIYTDEPFRIGDWIEWGDNAGVVEDISLRVSRVRTFDNELLTVPNSLLTEDVIKNPVAKDKLRLKIDFGIGYDDDIQAATEIVVEEAEAHPEILDDPAPSVRLVELGDSSVGLQSRVWIANPSRSDFVKVKSDYVQAVKERFDDQDVDIPYPNRTIGGEIEFTNVDAMADATETATDD